MTAFVRAEKGPQPVLEFDNLKIDLFTETASVRAVDGAALQVYPGEILAIVGESGSGKTVLTLGSLGLLPEGVSIIMQGTANCCGLDLTDGGNSARTILRNGQAGIVFQDPISALNPMKRIGPQICAQTVRLRGVSKSAGKDLALQLLRRTGIPDPDDRYHRYPHELSGGMLQRAMIALALAGQPRVLIADEPTTALDATVQAQILELIRDIRQSEDLAVVLITHDIGVVAAVADRVVVLYAGRVAETGAVEDVLLTPAHPYTQGLLAAVPDIRATAGTAGDGIPGTPPDQTRLAIGCPFVPRCTQAIDRCRTASPQLERARCRKADHLTACHVANAVSLGCRDAGLRD